MGYKPGEQDVMAYLYGELEGKEKELFEQYLLENAEARLELEKLKKTRSLMGHVKDKEVIAPPIFIGDANRRYLWDAPYFKTIVSIAASLLIVLLVGKLTGLQVGYGERELKISFGKPAEVPVAVQPAPVAPALTTAQVHEMIQESLNQNNEVMKSSFAETQKKLDVSITKNLETNSDKIDRLVRASSTASQEQIREFVATMQTENMQLVKNYFQLSGNEQKQYIEGLLVDFAKYLQQQRNDDLQVVQTQMKSLQQNTDIFKQETEQILTSIITTVGTGKSTMGARN